MTEMRGAQPRLPKLQNTAQIDEIDLATLLRILWRGKWWIALCAVVAVSIGAYYAFRVAVPLYTTSATVVLESREQSVVDFESVVSGLSGDQSTINTEIEVMRSRGLAGKLVEALDLVQDPEFNSDLGPSRPSPLDWTLGQVVGLMPALEPYLFAQDAPVGTQEQVFDRAINGVLRSVSISNVRNSLVFRVTVTTQDPAKSALIANTLADLYIRDQIDVKLEATAKATEWLGQRVAELQLELDTAQDALTAFTAEAELVTAAEVAALNRQIADLRLRLASTRVQASAAESNTGANVGRASTQVLALEASLAELEAQIASQSEALVEVQGLEREVEQARVLYEYFQNRLRETAVQQGIQQADARVLSLAVVPTAPSEPRKRLVLSLALVLGLLAGVGCVFLREMCQNGVRSADELEAITGTVVMGQLPYARARSRKAMLDYLGKKPNSRLAEAFRNLRTSVMLSNLDDPPQVIMSTSSLPGEGKTTQSLALAQNFAGMGKSVLLIEGDIRRRILAKRLGFSDEFGLVSVLSNEAKLADVVQRDPHLGAVDVLVADRSKTNPVDVFSSDRFRTFLIEMRRTYDIIIIDTPPILAVPDSRVIAQETDAVLYAVKWNSTPKAAIREGLRLLETVNVSVAGLVLTQIDQKGMERYGHGSYSQYGKGYYVD